MKRVTEQLLKRGELLAKWWIIGFVAWVMIYSVTSIAIGNVVMSWMSGQGSSSLSGVSQFFLIVTVCFCVLINVLDAIKMINFCCYLEEAVYTESSDVMQLILKRQKKLIVSILGITLCALFSYLLCPVAGLVLIFISLAIKFLFWQDLEKIKMIDMSGLV